MLDGKDGATGSAGANGTNGFSPLVSVTEITGGHSVTITDETGDNTFNVLDGKDGATGSQGEKGDPGTPGETGAQGPAGFGLNIGWYPAGNMNALFNDKTYRVDLYYAFIDAVSRQLLIKGSVDPSTFNQVSTTGLSRRLSDGVFEVTLETLYVGEDSTKTLYDALNAVINPLAQWSDDNSVATWSAAGQSGLTAPAAIKALLSDVLFPQGVTSEREVYVIHPELTIYFEAANHYHTVDSNGNCALSALVSEYVNMHCIVTPEAPDGQSGSGRKAITFKCASGINPELVDYPQVKTSDINTYSTDFVVALQL